MTTTISRLYARRSNAINRSGETGMLMRRRVEQSEMFSH
jgi:hypothetical protein